MNKTTFSTIDGQRAELETRLIAALVGGDMKTADQISAQLAQDGKLRLVPDGGEQKDK